MWVATLMSWLLDGMKRMKQANRAFISLCFLTADVIQELPHAPATVLFTTQRAVPSNCKPKWPNPSFLKLLLLGISQQQPESNWYSMTSNSNFSHQYYGHPCGSSMKPSEGPCCCLPALLLCGLPMSRAGLWSFPTCSFASIEKRPSSATLWPSLFSLT